MTQQPTIPKKIKITSMIVEELSGGGERNRYYDEIKHALNTITESYPFQCTGIITDSTFYRGRILKRKEKYNNINNLTTRSAEDITNFGRCHNPHQSVLYASTDQSTVFEELGVNTGDTVQLITIKYKNNNPIKTCYIGEIDNLRRHKRTSIITNDNFNSSLNNHLEKIDPLEKLRLEIVDAFISEKFRHRAKFEYEYKITAAFSNIIFDQSIESFFYPSVRHIGGWNLCILSEAFNNSFYIEESSIININETYNNGIFFTENRQKSKSIDPATGNIKWNDVFEAFRFRSFDEYILYLLSCPKHITQRFFLQIFKFSENNPAPTYEKVEQISKSITEQKHQAVGSCEQIDFIHFSFNENIDFNSLSNELNTKYEHWDFIQITCIRDVNSDEEINKVIEKINNGDFNIELASCVFDKTGNPFSMRFAKQDNT